MKTNGNYGLTRGFANDQAALGNLVTFAFVAFDLRLGDSSDAIAGRRSYLGARCQYRLLIAATRSSSRHYAWTHVCVLPRKLVKSRCITFAEKFNRCVRRDFRGMNSVTELNAANSEWITAQSTDLRHVILSDIYFHGTKACCSTYLTDAQLILECLKRITPIANNVAANMQTLNT